MHFPDFPDFAQKCVRAQIREKHFWYTKNLRRLPTRSKAGGTWWNLGKSRNPEMCKKCSFCDLLKMWSYSPNYIKSHNFDVYWKYRKCTKVHKMHKCAHFGDFGTKLGQNVNSSPRFQNFSKRIFTQKTCKKRENCPKSTKMDKNVQKCAKSAQKKHPKK